jgi:tripartite ATP-independent transporter DctP family solute receptor
MMLKKSRCLVLAMALVLAFVSCTTFAAKKPLTVIYGSVFGNMDNYMKGDLYFKKLVEKKSKGQILVQHYPQSQLGSPTEMYQATRTGAQHIVSTAIGEAVPFYAKLGTFDLPYLYRDRNHCLKVSEKFSSLIDPEKMASECGLRILSIRIRAPRQLTSKFPVNKLEDIKGMKIRIPQQPTSMALWEALGASPTVIPSSEKVTALATGVVVAQENPFDSNYIDKIYEYTKYCAETEHKTELVPVIINDNWWKSLTASQKKIITNAMDQSTKMVNKLVLKSEQDYKKSSEKVGMIFTHPDLTPFR